MNLPTNLRHEDLNFAVTAGLGCPAIAGGHCLSAAEMAVHETPIHIACGTCAVHQWNSNAFTRSSKLSVNAQLKRNKSM
jgi:hypothetical protein